MTSVIVTLYDDSAVAREVMGQLAHAGFDEAQIECIESEQEGEHHFRRYFAPELGDEKIDARETFTDLTDRGISNSEARHYTEEISRGSSLVLVQTDDEISGRAKQIMNQYHFEEEVEKTSYGEEEKPIRGGKGRSRRRFSKRDHR